MTTTETNEIVDLPLLALDAHPKNTHGEVPDDGPRLQELKASIEAIGQTDPCLVRPRPGDRYEILSGHLRVQARALLGLETVPCVVRDVDDETALTILLVSNEKEPVDPLLEADAIGDLLAKKAGDLRDAARLLGKTVRYVATRANLRTLSAKARELYRKGKLAAFTVAMLEDLARLEPHVQDELAAKGDGYWTLEKVRDKEDLDRLVGPRLLELGKAIWALDDATLVPKAGACVTCPKTSLRAPGLFDDGDADPTDPKQLAKAVCRDAACWREKTGAVTKQAIAEAKKEAKAEGGAGEVVVVADHGVEAPKGVKAVEKWAVHEVKAKTEGARPAVFLRQDGKVEKGYVAPERAPGGGKKTSSPAKAKAPKEKKEPKPGDKNFAERLEASRKEVAERRTRALQDSIVEALTHMRNSPSSKLALKVEPEAIEGLVVAFGATGASHSAAKMRSDLDDYKRLYNLARFKGSATIWAKELLPRVLECVTEELGFDDNAESELRWVAEVLGIDMAELDAKAVKEIPDPKWWGAPAPKNHLAIGMCRGCGCTHDHACAGGCSWVEKPDATSLQKKDKAGRYLPLGLCSSCAGAQPAGKKATKKKAKK